MKKDFVIPIAVLLIICIVITGALAATNQLTEPIIAEAAAVRSDKAMQELDYSLKDFSELDLAGLPESVVSAFSAHNDMGVNYVFTVSADGYGGKGSLIIMVAVNPDGNVIATKTLANGDTKGLGSRVSEPDFEGQFDHKPLSAADVADIDGITGATISSNAYRGAVLTALEAYEIITGGAK
ncbi:MAG: FMN-binding protein [Oscillospiraceae bacterium]|jgi:electron transport complex protein RnfG|nr:FMN-binding protein [Oscillospiraceae bacterium]